MKGLDIVEEINNNSSIINALGMKQLFLSEELLHTKGVAQLGALHKVFPHLPESRFEHSVKTAYNTIVELSMMPKNYLTHSQIKHIVAQALFHDVCHTPYSHELEHLAVKNHKEMTFELIKNNKLARYLERAGLDGLRLIQLITKKDHLSAIVGDKFGTDKITYVSEDSKRLGFGELEGAGKLLENISYDKNKERIILSRSGEEAAVEFAERYVDLYAQRYFHPTSLYNKRILTRIMHTLLADERDKESWQLWIDKDVDEYISSKAKTNEEIATLWNGFQNREHTRAHTLSQYDKNGNSNFGYRIVNKLKSQSIGQLTRLENDISDVVDLPKGSIIVTTDGNIEKASLPDIILKEEGKFLFKDLYPVFAERKMSEVRKSLGGVHIYANQDIESEIPLIKDYLSEVLL